VAVESTVPFLTTARVSVGGVDYDGHPVEFAAQGSVSGALVNGGLCDASDASGADWTGKVVLCERGVISFFDKVMNAQNDGAVGVVIYNNVPDEALFATLGAGNSSLIPALGMTQAQGQALVAAAPAVAALVSLVEQPASGYEAWDGTSMATPHVSAVAALVWSHHGSATNADIRDALAATALDLGAAGRDTSYGYGLVQAKAAHESFAGGCTPTEAVEVSCGDGVDNDCDGTGPSMAPTTTAGPPSARSREKRARPTRNAAATAARASPARRPAGDPRVSV
jgi:subtilisin family serine protease